jgi:hypothetical protein
MRYALLAFWMVGYAIALSTAAFALPAADEIPDILKPWVPWVEKRNPESLCARGAGAPVCEWPSLLELSLNPTGAGFIYELALDRPEEFPVPGGEGLWPQFLRLTQKGVTQGVPLPIVEREGRPTAFLPAGKHQITGSFEWTELPETLRIPERTALVRFAGLGENAKVIALPRDGRLPLRTGSSPRVPEASSLSIKVHRLLTDGSPFVIDTNVQVNVTGMIQELELDQIVVPESEIIAITTGLSYGAESKRGVVVRVPPGLHSVRFQSLILTPPEMMQMNPSTNQPRVDQEVWVWRTRPEQRLGELQGLTPIDPSQTDLPSEWHQGQAFIIKRGEQARIHEISRGQLSVSEGSLSLQRMWWLDLDGEGFTVEDTLQGRAPGITRIDVDDATSLGRVEVEGEGQILTKNPDSGSNGVEIRGEEVNLHALSRVEGATSLLPATSWQRTFDTLGATIALPPGWNLFCASGVDRVPGSWCDSWTLLDVFLGLIIALTTAKGLGKRWGWGVGSLLLLSHNQIGAPYLVFIHIVIGVALCRVLESGLPRTLARGYLAVTAVSFVVIAIRFVLWQVSTGFFPELEGSPTLLSYSIDSSLATVLLGFLSSAVLIIGVLLFFYYLLNRQWRSMAITCVVVASLMVVTPLLVTFSDNRFLAQTSSVRSLDFALPQAEVMRSAPMSAASESEDGLSIASSSLIQRMKTADARKKLIESDPNAQVPTGPGVPQWKWRSWKLEWNGPVSQDTTIKLSLVSPFWSMALALCRAALLAIILVGLIPRVMRSVLGAVFFYCAWMSLCPGITIAESFPTSQVLDELAERLERDRCHEHCAAVNSAHFRVDDDIFEGVISVSSRGLSVVTLPGPAEELIPHSIIIDGVDSSVTRRNERGFIEVRIPDGNHEIRFTSHISNRRNISLQALIPLRNVTVKAVGWEVDGIDAQGRMQESVSFARIVKEVQAGASPVEKDVRLPTWVHVDREFSLGLNWTVIVRVRRYGDAKQAAIVSVPLRSGERIHSPLCVVKESSVQVQFAQGVREIVCEGTIAEETEILLPATAEPRMSESWILNCSSALSCSFSGLMPAQYHAEGGYIWHPWTGEELRIFVRKPAAIGGKTSTIQRVNIAHAPGERRILTTLSFEVSASQPVIEKISLPESAVFQSASRDGVAVPLQPRGQEIDLPIIQGSHQYQVIWNTEGGQRPVARYQPPVFSGRSLSNITTEVVVSPTRWVLYARGPAWGPIFVYWGLLLCVIVAAILLARSRVAEVGFVGWILLGIGLSTVPVVAMIIPPCWLAVIRARATHTSAARWLVNSLQVALLVLTVMSLLVFAVIVSTGLTGSPDMSIVGYDSNNSILRWYQDTASNVPVDVEVFSVSVSVWRVCMFLWSLWLASSLIRWVSEAWRAFSHGGFWRSKS